ncbi:hypothetical protein [Neptuniibacter sp. QD37_11]|uniref:hypothetical protein n=1 Tax=Neptuniibacter sp. QD37_11 TaxID=3398209 RepID=UPI0039F45115
MKTHFHPCSDADTERAPCGTWLGETSHTTGDWSHVTCGHCLRNKDRIKSAQAADEKVIVEQMGAMVDHMSSNQTPNGERAYQRLLDE